MKRGVIHFCVGILLQIGAMYIISASPQLSMAVSESSQKIVYQQTLAISGNNGVKLKGDFSPTCEFYDNGISEFFPKVTLQLTFPFDIVFGDFSKDSRVAPFFKTAFSLMPLHKTQVGPLKSIPLALKTGSSGSLAYSRKLSPYGYGHLCIWSPLTESSSFGGLAAIFEWQSKSTLLRGGILVTESKEELEDRWTMLYHALPIASGGVGYLSLHDSHLILGSSIGLQSALLLRCSYDKAHGMGLTHSINLKVSMGGFIGSLQRIGIHQEVGAVGAKAFTTLDSPLQLSEINISYQKNDYKLACLVRDKHWRPTAYATMYQRRRQQMRASISMPLYAYTVSSKVHYEKRWNRSGSIGESIIFSLGVAGKIGDVTFSYDSTVTVGRNTVLQSEFILERSLNNGDTILIELEHAMQVVKLGGSWLHRFKNSQFKLEWHSSGAISITYSIFPTT